MAKRKVKKAKTSEAKGFLARLGPGFITGASDDDPSGIGTYSQAGAQLGFGIGWTMLLSYPLMVAIQEISARIGRVTGHGIAGNVCRNFGAPVIWFLVLLLFVANTINVAADLGAMGDATKLLIGGPASVYVVVFAAISVLAQIFFNYQRYVAILKWLTLCLFAYVIALAVVHVPWGEAVKGLLIPKVSWSGAFLTTLVAILGTTISPYLFIWQSSQEAEDQRIDNNPPRRWGFASSAWAQHFSCDARARSHPVISGLNATPVMDHAVRRTGSQKARRASLHRRASGRGIRKCRAFICSIVSSATTIRASQATPTFAPSNKLLTRTASRPKAPTTP